MPLLSHDQMYNASGTASFAPLIVELCSNRIERDREKAVFTTRYQREGYISLRKLFVEYVSQDPSEASFAEALFGEVGYWMKVSKHKEIANILPEWREEADIVRKSKAFKAMTKEIEDNGKSAFSAAKYLIEEPWRGRSRAARQKVDSTTKRASVAISDDTKRLKEAGLLN